MPIMVQIFIFLFVASCRAESDTTKPKGNDNVHCKWPEISHGQLQVAHTVYGPGESAHLTCHEGYQLDGPNHIVCGDDGVWRRMEAGRGGEQLPQCEAAGAELTCPRPVVPPSGGLEVEGVRVGKSLRFKHGSVVFFHCGEGYHLAEGSAQRVCGNGVWSGQQPVCVSTGCGAPPSAHEGYYLELSPEGRVSLPRHDKYSVGARVVHRCNPAHVLVGVDTYQCMTSGQWSPAVAPVCQAERSSAPPPAPECPLPARAPLTEQRLVRGWMTDEGASGGAVVEYSCVAGTRDPAEPCRPEHVTCWNGRWLGRIPRCLPVAECSHPPRVMHGDVYGSSRQPGSQVFYSCQTRYRLEGPNALSCDAGGCWSPRFAPICVAEPPPSSALLFTPAVITLLAVTAAVVLMLIGLLAFLIQRRPWKPLRRPPPPPPSVPPRPQDADRVALIAYPEGAQYVLPTYEEAVRSDRAAPGGVTPDLPSGGVGAPFRPLHHARSLPRRERLWRRDPESDSVSQRSVQSHHSASTRQSNTASNTTPSLLDSMGSTETMAASDAASTTLSAVANASVRGMCGSLASFDTSSVLNTEGVPLLEENETELETAEQPDTVSCGKLSSSGDSAASK